MGNARRMVAFAGAAIALMGCAEHARISLFDDEEWIADAGLAPPTFIEDASTGEPPGEPPLTPSIPDPDDPSVEDPDDEPDAEPPKRPPATTSDAGIITGQVEPDEAVAASALMLRYDFEGAGEVVFDRVGHAHATVRGGALLDREGGLPLDGVDDYVDMPNGVLSSQRSVTIVAWLRWSGGPCWQRIFDFGSTDAGEGLVGRARTSLFLTPSSCPYGYLLSMTERDDDQRAVAAGRSLPVDQTVQVALVLDADRAVTSIYVDGRREASTRNWHVMSDLDDVNNWLGRSQWIQDRYLQGRYDELRIYNRALTEDELAEITERGADRP